MRLFFGMIIGAALTVAAAYIYDTAGPPAGRHKPMVNWDVVSETVRDGSARVREQWDKLVVK